MIIPVILENSEKEVHKKAEIAAKFADLIQIDIAETTYVGNQTLLDIESIHSATIGKSIELDLMVNNPVGYLTKFYPNVTKVSYYVKEGKEVLNFIDKAKSMGYSVGLGIGPDTNMDIIYKHINSLNYVQFYTVIPGGKGRQFEKDVLKKIRAFRKKYTDIAIQVDGAINKETIPDLMKEGVNDFVVGSAIFNSSNPANMYIELTNMTNTAPENITSLASSSETRQIKQIAILGGAAWKEDDPAYKAAFETSKLLAENGYEVVNGGGPGVMEASTKGAHAGGGHVLAVTYHPNKPKRHYEGVASGNDADTEVITLDYFDRTKVMLQTTQAHIVFKGSIGTLSEFGMTWISSWIHEPNNKPIILYGAFWQEFLDLIEKHMLVIKGEEKLLKICTTPKEVIDYLKTFDA